MTLSNKKLEIVFQDIVFQDNSSVTEFKKILQLTYTLTDDENVTLHIKKSKPYDKNKYKVSLQKRSNHNKDILYQIRLKDYQVRSCNVDNLKITFNVHDVINLLQLLDPRNSLSISMHLDEPNMIYFTNYPSSQFVVGCRLLSVIDRKIKIPSVKYAAIVPINTAFFNLIVTELDKGESDILYMTINIESECTFSDSKTTKPYSLHVPPVNCCSQDLPVVFQAELRNLIKLRTSMSSLTTIVDNKLNLCLKKEFPLRIQFETSISTINIYMSPIETLKDNTDDLDDQINQIFIYLIHLSYSIKASLALILLAVS